MSLRVVFMGSADLSVPLLDGVADDPDIQLVGVVTQPDRPSGRGRRVSVSPVKARALERNLPVTAPERINTDEALVTLRDWAPDLAVVIAYGQILRRAVIDLPRLGCINVHTSLLPKYRGAAPIQWAIANGETETGVTTMLIDEGMDTGDMLLRASTPIDPDEHAPAVAQRLVSLAGPLLKETLHGWAAGTLAPQPQDHEKATLAPRLRKQDGQIDWTRAARETYDQSRGFDPWPGCFTMAPDGRGGTLALKVHALRLEEASGEPGEIVQLGGEGPLVAARSGGLRLLRVQPAGGKPMSGDAYVRGRRLAPGDRLGPQGEDAR